MKESEYIIITNLENLRMAKLCLRETMSGHGISANNKIKVMEIINSAIIALEIIMPNIEEEEE